MTWADIREIFYAIGATAGVIALARPAIESKFQRDQERLTGVRKLIDELALVGLASRIDNERRIPAKNFEPFQVLEHDLRHNVDSLRFSGPLAKYISHEVDAMVKSYVELRGYIQVDEWEPRTIAQENGPEHTVWVFNKAAAAFLGDDGVSRNYAEHLSEAAGKAEQIRRAFQRLQIIGEVHFLEVPLAGLLLRRRFKANGL
jgi:hypothetical protein